MDGWGSLTMLIKRQEAAKNRKVVLKYELQKRKESYLKGQSNQELEFPKISDAEMKILKAAIRKKYRTKKIKNILLNIILLTSILCLFYYILNKKGVFTY